MQLEIEERFLTGRCQVWYARGFRGLSLLQNKYLPPHAHWKLKNLCRSFNWVQNIHGPGEHNNTWLLRGSLREMAPAPGTLVQSSLQGQRKCEECLIPGSSVRVSVRSHPLWPTPTKPHAASSLFVLLLPLVSIFCPSKVGQKIGTRGRRKLLKRPKCDQKDHCHQKDRVRPKPENTKNISMYLRI